MRGDQCPYSHDPVPQPKAHAKALVRSQGRGRCGTHGACTAPTSYLEMVGDTGADERLGSLEALRGQGFEPGHLVTDSMGGGTGTQTLGFGDKSPIA